MKPTLLKTIEPPAGGLERLNRRLARRRRRPWIGLAVLLLGLAMFALPALQRDHADVWMRLEHPVVLLQQKPGPLLHSTTQIWVELPVSQAASHIYLMASFGSDSPLPVQ